MDTTTDDCAQGECGHIQTYSPRCGSPPVCNCNNEFDVVLCNNRRLRYVPRFMRHEVYLMKTVLLNINHLEEIGVGIFSPTVFLSLEYIDLRTNPELNCTSLVNIPTPIEVSHDCGVQEVSSTHSSSFSTQEDDEILRSTSSIYITTQPQSEVTFFTTLSDEHTTLMQEEPYNTSYLIAAPVFFFLIVVAATSVVYWRCCKRNSHYRCVMCKIRRRNITSRIYRPNRGHTNDPDFMEMNDL